jgi:hypothetical protein
MAKSKAIYEYNPKYAIMLLEYFDVSSYERLELTDKDGNIVDVKIIPTDPPNFYGFARRIGIPSRAIKSWCETHEDFKEAWDRAEDCLKDIIFTNGLLGKYDKTVTIFSMKNLFGWTDRVEQKLELGSSLTSLLSQISQQNNSMDMMQQRELGIKEFDAIVTPESKHILEHAKTIVNAELLPEVNHVKG